MTQPQLTVVIIGGGIGGLFAANALIAHGFDVSVYEQAPALGEVGAGVFLTPNSVRQLQRVGLGHQVERWGARVGHGSHYFRHDGAPIAPVQVTDSAGWNATFGMHRADLVEMLARALPSGVVRTGHRGTGFEQTSEVARVSFANGAVAEGDVVIAAMAFTPNSGPMRRRRPGRSSTGPLPIAACCRMRAFRTGRPIAGRCGSARENISSAFRCDRASSSTMSASCRPMRK
jgi:glycine/D-amino acid oxidase-like deaminating enzyme